MNDDEIRNIYEALRRFSEAVDRTGDPLLDFRNQTKRAADAASEEANKRKEAMEKQRQSIAGFSTALISITQQIANGRGNFSALNGAIDLTSKALGGLAGKLPIVGGVFKGAVEGLAEGVKFITAEFDKAYTTFEQLSDTGLVRTFEDLQDTASKTKLVFQDVAKALGNNTTKLAFFGGSVESGLSRFKELAEYSLSMRRDFQKLGVTASDFNEYQLNYMHRLQLTGQLEGKLNSDLRRETEEYIIQLDAISKLTGKTRKETEKAQEERLASVRFSEMMRTLPTDTQARIQNFLDLLEPSRAKQFEAYFGSGGMIVGAAKDGVKELQSAFFSIANAVRYGQAPLHELFNLNNRATEQFINQNLRLFQAREGELEFIKNYQDLLRAARRPEAKSIEEAKEAARATLRNTKGTNAALASTRTNLYEASSEIEQLATSSEVAARAVQLFSVAVHGVAKFVNENIGTGVAGENIPLTGAEITQKVMGMARTWIGSKLPGLLSWTGGAAAGGAAATSNLSKSELEKFINFGTGGGSYENFMQMDEDTRNRFISMAMKYNKEFKGDRKLSVVSSYRSPEQQQAMYDESKMNPAAYPYGVDPPSKSKHVKGLALDLPKTDIQTLKMMGLLSDSGFKSTSPVHIERLRKGGVVPAPQSGDIYQLDGNELVQPLDPDSVLQELATKPKASSMLGSKTTSRDLVDATYELNRKYDQMIHIMNDMRNIQKRLMMRTYA